MPTKSAVIDIFLHIKYNYIVRCVRIFNKKQHKLLIKP